MYTSGMNFVYFLCQPTIMPQANYESPSPSYSSLYLRALQHHLTQLISKNINLDQWIPANSHALSHACRSKTSISHIQNSSTWITNNSRQDTCSCEKFHSNSTQNQSLVNDTKREVCESPKWHIRLCFSLRDLTPTFGCMLLCTCNQLPWEGDPGLMLGLC